MIGLIGGYGAVGLAAARMLQAWGRYPLRIGGRHPETVDHALRDEFTGAQWTKVEVEDDQSLEHFLKDCHIVINCAGPSHGNAMRVARLCARRGCHHVGAGVEQGIESLGETLPGVAIVYAAGATPGLTGLLPRWLAGSLHSAQSLVCYAGALGVFTPAAAEDYLLGGLNDDSEARAAWKNGARTSSALTRKSARVLPFFPREVAAYPYLDSEAEQVARELQLQDGEWYITIDGEQTVNALNSARTQYRSDPHGAVQRLCLAARLDSNGRSPYFNILAQVQGDKDGITAKHTLILQAKSTSELSGVVTASTAIAVMSGEIPVGVHALAALPDPLPVTSRLKQSPAIGQLKIHEHSIDGLLQVEEGEI
jgi:hypothetical protein